MKRFTVDVTTLIAFGHDSNTIDRSDDAIQAHLELVLPTISRRITSPFPFWRYIKLPSDRRFERALAAIRQWLDRPAGRDAQAPRTPNPTGPHDPPTSSNR